MTSRNFAYDHPHYTVARSHDAGIADVASATEFAKFRSRLGVLVHTVDVVVNSAASVASAIITILHNGSVAATLTFDSANSVGVVATKTINRTLASVGDRLGLMHDQGGGEYHVVYTYQVLPGNSVVVA